MENQYNTDMLPKWIIEIERSGGAPARSLSLPALGIADPMPPPFRRQVAGEPVQHFAGHRRSTYVRAPIPK